MARQCAIRPGAAAELRARACSAASHLERVEGCRPAGDMTLPPLLIPGSVDEIVALLVVLTPVASSRARQFALRSLYHSALFWGSCF
jgi:hypothetical protein